MAFFKCKMCGGELNIAGDEKICECEFCGTTQTVPSSRDENLQNLFNRANTLRIKCEFDKAERLYEKIIASDETQAEAYWGLILCKYGIEYVEDPQTFKRIPTCHRASYDAVVSDEDYKSAIEYADTTQRSIYESEAREIDRIQKEILALAQSEENYDVFICYKETDASGARTQDSVIANDIYHQLTNEGLKVFYAAITLEDKLGKSYEPCIFAALNSAKVMLVIGTKPEYFSAVWVKNEWSRFLKIIEKDRSKLLIPCYRDMDAYELPEEFAHLQAQDMAKIGFINDVVRGIKKVTTPETKQETVTTATQTAENANGNLTALLERGFMALEDGEWEKADDFFEKVLNFDAKFAEAYLGKLMAELHIRVREDLSKCEETFEENPNYQKVIRFGDDALKKELEGYINCIEERIKEETEKRRKEKEKREAEFRPILEKNAAKNLQSVISAGNCHTVGLKNDGTVVAVGNNDDGQCNVRNWTDMVAVSAGYHHTVGLKNDGTVVALGDNDHRQCNVRDWTDMVAVSAGYHHTVGLKNDGTVVAVGDNDHGQCDVRDWTDIVAVSAGDHHTVGLKGDGTVVAVGSNTCGECKVSSWKNIVAVSAGDCNTVGLKNDGTVVAVGDDYYGRCDVRDWIDIIAISAGSCHTVGLKNDGTVVAVGDNDDGECDVRDWTDMVAVFAGRCITVGLKNDGTVVAVGINYHGQCDVSDWQDIQIPIEAESVEELFAKRREVLKQRERELQSKKEEFYPILEKNLVMTSQNSIAVGCYHTVGLKSDGTVIATEYIGDKKSYYGQCEVSDFSDIVAVATGSCHTVGLKSDGTVVAVGNNENGQCNVSSWRDIAAFSAGNFHTVGLKFDGTVVAIGSSRNGQCEVSDWNDIAAVSAGSCHTVGLKYDGTVVSTKYIADSLDSIVSSNSGQCEVSHWKDIVAISAGYYHTVGLKSDGTVVAVGNNKSGQCNVSEWRDIVAISAGDCHTVGLKRDGTVVATKYVGYSNNYCGQCDVSHWENIVAISAGDCHTVGLKRDGTVVAAGSNYRGKSNVGAWQDIQLPIEAESVAELQEKRRELSAARAEKLRLIEQQKEQYRNAGVCQYCGGELKGLLFKKCVKCGKPKDY
ncbi:MAG: TIR domain-containing protein [Clostridia bacterium]|nr:TIR domain-containing protein [Clostridia bacterium]